MKEIIVTAPTSAVASGFIRFAQPDYRITTVGRRESDITCDFSTNQKLVLPTGADAVVHFAGMFLSRSGQELLELVETNVSGIMKLCAAAKESRAKQIVYISSIYATLKQGAPYFNYYALTKRQAEELARLYCWENHIPLCIIRPSQIFGLSVSYAKAQPLFYTMLKNAVEGLPIKIYGKNDALRNYIFSNNLYQMIIQTIQRRSDDTIDVIDRKNYRLSEVAKCIIDAFDSSSAIEFCPDKPDQADNPFSTEVDYFQKWNVPFIPLEKAVHSLAHAYKRQRI